MRSWWGAIIGLGPVVLSTSACGLWPKAREAVTPTPSANDGTLKYTTVANAEELSTLQLVLQHMWTSGQLAP